MSFGVYLIYVRAQLEPQEAGHLSRNCTHITGRYWMYEGNPDALEVRFDVIDQGITSGVGDIYYSEKLMIEHCEEVFMQDVTQEPDSCVAVDERMY